MDIADLEMFSFKFQFLVSSSKSFAFFAIGKADSVKR